MAAQWLDTGIGAHRAASKAWSVGWPQRTAAGVTIDVRTYGAGSGYQLGSTACAGHPVRFGTHRGRIAKDARVVAQRDWAAFTNAPAATAWTIEFLSPTTFRRANAFHPLPTPATILRGLEASWRRYAPIRLEQSPRAASDEVLVTDIAGESVTMRELQRTGPHRRATELTISGFVGSMRLVCPGPAATPVGQLLAWAEFTGIGAWTTRGLGTVRVTPG